eukprot:COSAG01_NODE_5729_length_4071_cov_9.539023_7_plen_109_part_00
MLSLGTLACAPQCDGTFEASRRPADDEAQAAAPAKIANLPADSQSSAQQGGAALPADTAAVDGATPGHHAAAAAAAAAPPHPVADGARPSSTGAISGASAWLASSWID